MFDRLSNDSWPHGFIHDLWHFQNDHVPERLREQLPPEPQYDGNGTMISYEEWLNELTGTADYVITAAMIRPQDLTILRRHYKEGLKFKEIADIYGVTVSIVTGKARRGIRSIRKIRWLMKLLSMGVSAYSEREYAEKETAAFIDAVEKAVESRVAELLSDDHAEKETANEDFSPDVTKSQMTIEYLNLSVRSYNALWRAGYRTVGDILNLESGYELLNIRNFGVNSYKDTLGKLEANGFNVQHLKDCMDR